MKTIQSIALISAVLVSIGSCAVIDQNYPDGYESRYYVSFDYEYDDLGNPVMENKDIAVDRDSKERLELGVKFYSEMPMDSDVEVRLYLRNSQHFLTGMKVIKKPGMYSTPDSLAVPGIDFNILDCDGKPLVPVRTDSLMYYSIVFEKAKKDVRKLYVEMLDNQDYSNVRSAWLSLSMSVPDQTTTESYYNTSWNILTSDYQVYAYNHSYVRRLDIR